MGKLNLIISDEIDTKFRAEVFKRKGMKKGNLTDALEEALDLWIKSDVIEAIKKKALSKEITEDDFKLLVKTLASQGEEALPALSDLLNKESLTSSELAVTAEAICEVKSQQAIKESLPSRLSSSQPSRAPISGPV
jgi:hypothetical protein